MVARVGILALQGDVSLHAQALARLSVATRLVKKPADFAGIDGLIIPGGESTTLLYLAETFGLLEEISNFAADGGKILGTCAGAILLAKKVSNPHQKSLGLIDIEIERNAYGRQLDSFESLGEGKQPLPQKLKMTFIRAPKITSIGKNVKTLATYKIEPVLVQQKNILVTTFHPELTNELSIYQLWLSL